MGVLVRKKKRTNEWYVVARAMGNRTSKKVPDRKTGNALKRKWQEELALGLFEWPEKSLKLSPYFGNFVKDYIEVAKTRLKPNTWTGYKKLIQLHLLKPWGKKCLCDITKQQIKKLLLTKQADGLNINNLRICISAIFQEAVEREVIVVNPAHNLGKVFRNNHVPKTQGQALTKAERDKFLSLAKKQSPYYAFYLTLFKAGVRLGEALAVAVEDINWNTNQLCVRRNLSHNYWTTPKNGRTRQVNLSPHLVGVLRDCCNGKKITCKSSPDKVKLIFSNKAGEPLNPDIIRIEFHRMLAEAGVRKIRLQDCRHTYASILLTEGANLFFVQKQLGHQDPTLTCSLYGHLLPETRDTAALLD